MGIETLYDLPLAGPRRLPERLAECYDGDLAFQSAGNRPYVIGNFVTSVDGVASYGIPGKSGGGVISDFNKDDRFVMALLRACADAVMIGSGTLHGDSGHVRTPEFIYPELREEFRAFRSGLGKPPYPLNVVLTRSGRIDLDEATFHTEGLSTAIMTTRAGAERLERAHGAALGRTNVRSVGETDVTPGTVLDVLAEEFGATLVVHEGGPRVFGEFLAAGAIDELFLTLAPQVAGRRNDMLRPGLAGETIFLPETAPRLRLLSLKRGADHLFLRYGLER
jgi:riboflavin biosynthesis pyrimidine reductase